MPVAGTLFDFTNPASLFEKAAEMHQEIPSFKGFDDNFVVSKTDERVFKEVATAYDKVSGRFMRVQSDMPALQFYTCGNLNENGKLGAAEKEFSAFCLETQFSPNTPNLPQFPSCVLKAGEQYSRKTVYQITTK